MPLTREDVEMVITTRAGAFLAEAGMTVEGGYNPWLTDPIGWSLRMLGYTPASHVDVVDTDLEDVTAAHIDALFDLAELKALEAVATNFTGVDVQVGPVKESRSMLGDRLNKLIDNKRAQVAARYGRMLAYPLEPGTDEAVRIHAL